MFHLYRELQDERPSAYMSKQRLKSELSTWQTKSVSIQCLTKIQRQLSTSFSLFLSQTQSWLVLSAFAFK